MKLLFENWRNYSNQLNEEQLLVEGRIDIVKKKYPELSKTFSTTGLISPLNVFINADPSGNQKYLMGMASILNNTIKKAIELPSESDHLKPGSLLFALRAAKGMVEYLEKFHELQSFIRDQDKPFKDINNIEDFNALKAVVLTAEGKKRKSEWEKQQQLGASQKAKEESRIIFKQGVIGISGEEFRPDDKTKNYIIRRPETTHASCHYGVQAQWCISYTQSLNHFDEYTEKGVAFYFITFANLPGDHINKQLALAIYPGQELEIYDGEDNEVGEEGLLSALVKNLLNLKKYPAAQEWLDPGQPSDYEKAKSDYKKAASDLGLDYDNPKVNVAETLQTMAKAQRDEIINLAQQDAQENPAGPTKEQFLEVIEQHKLKNIEVEIDMPEETGIAHSTWESFMYIDLNEIVEASPHRLKWKGGDETEDINIELEKGFYDYVENAFRDNQVYPTSIELEPDSREFKITFERGHGSIETFKEFMSQARYDDSNIERGFYKDLIELLGDAGLIGRDEREEYYWPDPEEKEKQLELPLQEIFRRWRQFRL